MKNYSTIVATMAQNAPALSGAANLDQLLKIGKTERQQLQSLAHDVEVITAEGGISGRVQLARRINLDGDFLSKTLLQDPRGQGSVQPGSPLDILNSVHSMFCPETGPAARAELIDQIRYAVNASNPELVKEARERVADLPAQTKLTEKDDAKRAEERKRIRDNARTHIGNQLAAAKTSGKAETIELWQQLDAAAKANDVSGLIALGNKVKGISQKISRFRRSLYLPVVAAEFDELGSDELKNKHWEGVVRAVNAAHANYLNGAAESKTPVDPDSLVKALQAAARTYVSNIGVRTEKDPDEKAAELRTKILASVRKLAQISEADGGITAEQADGIRRALKKAGIVEKTKEEGNAKVKPVLAAEPAKPRKPRQPKAEAEVTTTGPVIEDAAELSTELAG